ncbi:MAG: dihydrofolate reductase [Bacteroidia bacterium]|nr:dihydrofolate reductase [Bacteroidia bacterium]MBP9690031.1 dihydrofolate reductase [Bacteroidia bacterium]
MIISLVVATDLQNGIGVNNQLLCHLPADLKYFRQTTTGHCIVMGRKTYESIGKPLPNRTNIIVTRNAGLSLDGCVVVTSLDEAIEYAKQQNETELMITGGGSIYVDAIKFCDKVYLTRIEHVFNADTFFPEIPLDKFKLTKAENHQPDEKNIYPYTFELWERIVE